MKCAYLLAIGTAVGCGDNARAGGAPVVVSTKPPVHDFNGDGVPDPY